MAAALKSGKIAKMARRRGEAYQAGGISAQHNGGASVKTAAHGGQWRASENGVAASIIGVAQQRHGEKYQRGGWRQRQRSSISGVTASRRWHRASLAQRLGMAYRVKRIVNRSRSCASGAQRAQNQRAISAFRWLRGCISALIFICVACCVAQLLRHSRIASGGVLVRALIARRRQRRNNGGRREKSEARRRLASMRVAKQHQQRRREKRGSVIISNQWQRKNA